MPILHPSRIRHLRISLTASTAILKGRTHQMVLGLWQSKRSQPTPLRTRGLIERMGFLAALPSGANWANYNVSTSALIPKDGAVRVCGRVPLFQPSYLNKWDGLY